MIMYMQPAEVVLIHREMLNLMWAEGEGQRLGQLLQLKILRRMTENGQAQWSRVILWIEPNPKQWLGSFCGTVAEQPDITTNSKVLQILFSQGPFELLLIECSAIFYSKLGLIFHNCTGINRPGKNTSTHTHIHTVACCLVRWVSCTLGPVLRNG